MKIRRHRATCVDEEGRLECVCDLDPALELRLAGWTHNLATGGWQRPKEK